MPTIRMLKAREILDSRGRPTLEVRCTLASGASAVVQIPAGASTGSAEALELRDGNPHRYGGFGCLQAVHHVETNLQSSLAGRAFPDQRALDTSLIELDGTAQKSRLGGNTILGVSLSFARAVAAEFELPLYLHFADLLEPGKPLTTLPRPTINLFSGGKHAGGQVEIQDVLVLANAARTVEECLAWTYDIYQSAAILCRERYDMRALVGDEGGLAPPFPAVTTMIQDAVDAIAASGKQPGEQVSLCIDVAASHFATKDGYLLGSKHLTGEQMIATIDDWVTRFPIVSVEDGLAENAWADWPTLHQHLRGRALTLGDDLLATNPARIERAIEAKAADALLLKVNQIGTLTEAAEACRLARSAGWQVVVSARSGETEDNWLADLAVGWSGDALKVGSITRSERLAKWNRLLAIEAETGLPVAHLQ